MYALKSTDERSAVAVRAKTNTHTHALSRSTGLCWELAGAVGVLHGRAFARCSGLAWLGVAWLSACVRARGGLRGRGSHVSVRPDVTLQTAHNSL